MRKTNAKAKEESLFFGYGNSKSESGGFVTYKSILSNDQIIVRTDNVKSIRFKNSEGIDEVGWILVVGDYEYLSLQPWQVKQIFYIDENGTRKRSFLVKLNRNYFYIKRMAEPFETKFKTTDSFDSLFEHARLQELSHTKVKI